MKVKLSLSILESYTTIEEKKVEIECDEIKHPSDIRQALEAIHKLAIDKEILEFSDGVALDLFLRMREHQIKEEATKQAKLDNVKEPDSWRLRSDIDELKKALAQKTCQLDGVIKSHNPDYVPIQDQDKTQNL